ncbi:MAG: Lrp/AsnC family transcriptional regulator [Amylibacter sp.]|jgi:DNA-binding Lrp family transcriptional regulator|tara:strand:- start:105759 stop:106181 length:423 start_codon:yes stop_codon:yes gene_type:complete
MDKMDIKLLNILKKNARTSVSNIAIDLQITRTTVRTRMRKLKETGEISGFTVITKSDVSPAPVRGLVMLQIEGTGAHTIRQKLLLLQQVYSVHTTNGKWDMIIDLGTQSLAELDEILSKIRKFSGVKGSETSLLLSTKYA